MPGEGYVLSTGNESSMGTEGSGLTSGSEPRFIAIGQVTGSFGVRGELKVAVMTDFPERFSALKTVYLGEEQKPYALLSSRVQREGRQVLLRLGGVLDCDQADKLRGQMIYIPVEQAMPLEEGQYYIYQILGLSVETEAGEPLGLLTEVLLIGSNDVYVVSDGSREILIPALEDVILTVDLPARKMIVRLPDGLL